jgi:hypothetical protein
MRSEQIQNQSLLRNHPDKNVVSYLCTGLRHCFDTLVQSEKVQTKECKNNLSARVQETVVSALIDKELQKCFIYEPYTQPPFDNYRISPIGHKKLPFRRDMIILIAPSIFTYDIEHCALSINSCILRSVSL